MMLITMDLFCSIWHLFVVYTEYAIRTAYDNVVFETPYSRFSRLVLFVSGDKLYFT